MKLADLEDRLRRNNVKIRWIPESVKPPDLNKYFTNILKDSITEALLEDLIIDIIIYTDSQDPNIFPLTCQEIPLQKSIFTTQKNSY